MRNAVVITEKKTTARYYVSDERGIISDKEHEFTAEYHVFTGTISEDGVRVLCEVTPTLHMVLDASDVRIESIN